ncbi:PAS domain-containing protein [Amycolatopsis sp. 3B14]|uniref:PAS domain-containing protein n=1 Tax=Amycolatopsis sp. 3B14 TaxID=3243600 RepID=UPI003D988439
MSDRVDFEAVFRAGATPSALLSRDFVIVAVNDAYEKVSGRQRAELVGHDVFEAFPDDPEAARALRVSLDRVLATAERNVMALLKFDVAVPGGRNEVEHRFWSPVNVPVLDDDGSVRMILHRVEEVTEVLRELGLPRQDAAEMQAGQAEVYARSKELERTNQRLAAATDITTAMLADAPADVVLRLIAFRAKEIAGATSGCVLLREGDGFVVAAEAGDAAVDPAALAAEVRRTGRPGVRVTGDGVAVAVPLRHEEEVRGVLVVTSPPGRSGLGSPAILPLEPFATQAELALELGDRRRDTARLLLLEDRDRIARDLHRSVVSRLFQLGLELSSAAELIIRAEPARRVRGVVVALDGVVQDLHTAVFRTGGVRPDGRTFRERLQDLIDHAAESQGFATTSRIDPRLNGVLGELAEQHLIAVLSEVLIGEVRDRTAQVTVSVGVRPDRVVGEVTVRGLDLPAGIAELGLTALARRAEQLGGSLTLDTGDGERHFTWQMPLAGDHG